MRYKRIYIYIDQLVNIYISNTLDEWFLLFCDTVAEATSELPALQDMSDRCVVARDLKGSTVTVYQHLPLFDKHLETWVTCWRSRSREAPRVLRVRRLDIQLTRSLLRAPSAASLVIGLTRLGALSFVLLQTAGLHLD